MSFHCMSRKPSLNVLLLVLMHQTMLYFLMVICLLCWQETEDSLVKLLLDDINLATLGKLMTTAYGDEDDNPAYRLSRCFDVPKSSRESLGGWWLWAVKRLRDDGNPPKFALKWISIGMLFKTFRWVQKFYSLVICAAHWNECIITNKFMVTNPLVMCHGFSAALWLLSRPP